MNPTNNEIVISNNKNRPTTAMISIKVKWFYVHFNCILSFSFAYKTCRASNFSSILSSFKNTNTLALSNESRLVSLLGTTVINVIGIVHLQRNDFLLVVTGQNFFPVPSILEFHSMETMKLVQNLPLVFILHLLLFFWANAAFS